MMTEDGPTTLPNAAQAYVEEKKITGYLLSDTKTSLSRFSQRPAKSVS